MNNLLDKDDSMTAQQVREFDWTGHEKRLDELVALHVMGWRLDNPLDAYYRTGGHPRCVSSWHPSTDMNDAMKVAGKFENYQITKAFAAIMIGKVGNFLSKAIWANCGIIDKKTPRAICIATLIAEKNEQ